MSNSEFGFKKFSQGKQNFEKFKEELRHADSGIDISKIKEEVCKQTRDKVVKEVICNGKTYKDIKTSSRRGDWRIIFTLMRYGKTNPDEIIQLLPNDSRAKIDEKYFMKMLEHAWKLTKQYRKAIKAVLISKPMARRLLMMVIAEDIIHEYKPVYFIKGDDEKQKPLGFYIFDRRKGIFVNVDEIMESIISDKLKDYEKTGVITDTLNNITEIKKLLKRKTMKIEPPEPMRIAFKNGTLEWVDKGIKWYDSKIRTAKVYAYNYVPRNVKIEEILKLLGKKITIEDLEELAKEECPKALEVFKQWVGDKWPTLLEIIGYTLYPAMPYKKAFMLLGGANAGKTTFINFINDLIGDDNFEAMDMGDIIYSRIKHTISYLEHTLVTASSETIGYLKRETINKLVALIEGDPVAISSRFRTKVNFKPYAKLITANNRPPKIEVKVFDEFWKKWIIVEFPNKFPRDDEWYEKTFTEKEMDGVITVAILAFLRVLQQGRFDFEQTPEEVRDIWLRKKNLIKI